MKKLSEAKQSEIVLQVLNTFSYYKDQTTKRKERMTNIYQWVSTFVDVKTQDWQTVFKVNKMHEIENRIVPRIMSKQPKPIVNYKSDDYIENAEIDISELTKSVEDRLCEIYKKQDMIESLRLRARWWIRYWLCFAKLTPKYRIKRTKKREEEIEYDEMWNEKPIVVDKIEENVYEQYTGIDIKSYTDIYFDPRYTRLEDMPSIIDVSKNVRLSYFTQNRSKYMNVDKLIQCCMWWNSNEQIDQYKARIQSITWITPQWGKIMRADTLDVKCYYWYYDLSENAEKDWYKNERLYEFWTVDDVLLVYAKEITTIPFEDFRVFEDTETFLATGYLEPILWLQDEMNWKKNRASEYVNKLLKPDYVRSPISWIDPRKINQWHWNLLVTNKSAQDAIANLVQLPLPELHPSYFQEQNDIERQFQAATFTINTNTPTTQQSLTETATWAKIQAFETDAVTGETRKHFEESLVRLTYKILQFEFDNATENIKTKVNGEEDAFREINKEALRDAVERYDIQIESGSSSYDNEEARRNDAIAQSNISLQYQKAWLPINMKKTYEKVMQTFPYTDIKGLYDNTAMLQQMQAGWAGVMNIQQPQAPTGAPQNIPME